jgi:outer membrane protein
MFFVLIFFQSCIVMANEGISLKDVVMAGLERNIAIKEGTIDIEKSDMDLELAYKNYYPDIGISSTYTRLEKGPEIPVGIDQNFNFISIEGSRDNYSTQISLQQPVYLGGKIRLGIEQTELAKKLTVIEFEKKKEELVLNIIKAYFNVLMARDRIVIEEEAVKLIKEQKKMVEASLKVGMSLKTDLLNLEIEESKAISSLKDARNKNYLAKKNLELLTGINLDKFELNNTVEEPGFIDELDILYQKAIVNRNELKLMEINREMLKLNLEMEKSSTLPNIMMIANYNWQGDEFSLEDGSWNISLSANIPIIDWGESKLSQNKVLKELEKLEESKNNLLQIIKLDIMGLVLNIKNSLENISIQEKNYDKAIKNLELEDKRFKAGLGKNIDVLNAQFVLKQSNISRIQTLYQYKLYLFELIQKTGNLLKYFEGVSINEG